MRASRKPRNQSQRSDDWCIVNISVSQRGKPSVLSTSQRGIFFRNLYKKSMYAHIYSQIVWHLFSVKTDLACTCSMELAIAQKVPWCTALHTNKHHLHIWQTFFWELVFCLQASSVLLQMVSKARQLTNTSHEKLPPGTSAILFPNLLK